MPHQVHRPDLRLKIGLSCKRVRHQESDWQHTHRPKLDSDERAPQISADPLNQRVVARFLQGEIFFASRDNQGGIKRFINNLDMDGTSLMIDI